MKPCQELRKSRLHQKGSEIRKHVDHVQTCRMWAFAIRDHVVGVFHFGAVVVF